MGALIALFWDKHLFCHSRKSHLLPKMLSLWPSSPSLVSVFVTKIEKKNFWNIISENITNSSYFSFFLTAAPDPPEDPEVLSKTKQSVILSWFTSLHDGGSPIIGYRVEMRLVDSALWLPCHSEPVCNTEFVVENLTPGSGYRFRVAAINRAGIGEPVELPQTVQLGRWICGLGLASFVMLPYFC